MALYVHVLFWTTDKLNFSNEYNYFEKLTVADTS